MLIHPQNFFLKPLFPQEKQLKNISEEYLLMTKLNQEEQEFLDSYNNDEWYSVGTAERLHELQSFAEATLTKEETITVQLSYLDLEAIQAKAKEEGISERRLISSLLHKYVTGKLVENS